MSTARLAAPIYNDALQPCTGSPAGASTHPHNITPSSLSPSASPRTQTLYIRVWVGGMGACCGQAPHCSSTAIKFCTSLYLQGPDCSLEGQQALPLIPLGWRGMCRGEAGNARCAIWPTSPHTLPHRPNTAVKLPSY